MISLAFSSYGLYNVLLRLGQIAPIAQIDDFIHSIHF